MRSWRALLLLPAFLLAACAQGKLTEQNIAKIADGMSMEQVTAIIGPPTETQTGAILGISGTSSTWKEGDATLSLQFVNDRLVLKSYVKGGAR
jgi:hypothetical protein